MRKLPSLSSSRGIPGALDCLGRWNTSLPSLCDINNCLFEEARKAPRSFAPTLCAIARLTNDSPCVRCFWGTRKKGTWMRINYTQSGRYRVISIVHLISCFFVYVSKKLRVLVWLQGYSQRKYVQVASCSFEKGQICLTSQWNSYVYQEPLVYA